MVRTQRSSFEFLHLEQRPDAGRIAGTSTALAIHVIALMILLAPMAPPPVAVTIDKHIPPDPPRTVVEPTKPEPVEVLVKQDVVTKPEPVVRPQQPDSLIANNEIIVDNGTIAVETTTISTETVEPGPSISEPLAGAHLQYANAPPPVYPRAALRDRLSGTVMLEILVDIDGRPLKVSIAQSSGHRELDRAALDHVLKRWTFRPAIKDGQAVQAIGLVPIAFNLR